MSHKAPLAAMLVVFTLAHCGRSELFGGPGAPPAGTVDAAIDATEAASGSSSGTSSSSSTSSGSSGSGSGSSGSSGSSSSSSSGGTPVDGGSSGGTVTPADAGPLPPSCAPGGPGLTDCGKAKESCCISLEVEGGTFYRTYDPATVGGDIQTGPGGSPLDEADPATISSFRLDKYLVTVGRFRQFVHALDQDAGANPAPGSGKHSYLNGGKGLVDALDAGAYEQGWASGPLTTIVDVTCAGGNPTWTASPSGDETLPINCVNWADAYAFCIWDGGFLPTTAEWEYAAAGGSEQREFPWGSSAPGAASKYAVFDCDYQAASPGPPTACSNGGNLAPVGMAPAGAGRWGQLDLVGNVWQFALDGNVSPYTEPCVDCGYFQSGTRFYEFPALRGGDFSAPEYDLSPSAQGYAYAVYVSPQYGFRCARAP